MSFTAGMRGELTFTKAMEAALAFRDLCRRYPKAVIVLCIAGYDSDPREIFEIPEAVEHYRSWAKFARIKTYQGALAVLHPDSAAVLATCGALSDVSPDQIRVVK
jgi:hypothetical protein